MRTRSAGPITPSEKSHHLVRRLGSRDAEERRVAKDDFLRMATENPALFHADLADIIQAITGNRKRTSLVVVAFGAIAYGVYMAAMILASILNSEEIIGALVWAFAVLFLVGLTGSGISRAIVGKRRNRLTECITDIDDLNALPALIELLEFTNPAVQNAIMPPLTRLLSRLRASDAHLLGYLHRTALARTLSTTRARKFPASFFVSVLQAFEQIGDSQVLPAVTWLAQGKGVAGDHPRVQEAAQTCQGHLEEMLRRHQAPYLLLRPSSLTEASHALLRPVAGAPDDAPHELLRPDNSPRERPVRHEDARARYPQIDNSPREQTVPVMIRPQGLEPEILFNTLQRPEDPEHR
jgi:hypothetical protein